ncbi:MAG: quinone-dependent dihydroorotate dehydrogenase [Sphingomicrobium sp.]
MQLYPFLRPLAFALDAEAAHRATIAALKLMPPQRPPVFAESLRSTVAGIDFPTPVGLAAGFDKDAQVPEQMLGLGFGFVEVGTVTPLAQAGNPKPRMFRLAEDRAVINRLGFNNGGHQAAFARLKRYANARGIIGVNIGANKDSADRIADYAAGVRTLAGVARYVTINISSPNTPGLRQLQDEGALHALLSAVVEARGGNGQPSSDPSTGPRPAGPPIFLKVAPDLGESEPDQIVRVAARHGIDAIIVANTSVSRPPLKSRFADETGGLSGEPLKSLALTALRNFREASGGTIPLIGVGGIGSVEDAWQRIRAGANLVQLYTAMVYEGPGIARRIATGLADRLAAEGFSNIAEAVGTG